MNDVILVAFIALVIAQVLKIPIFYFKKGKLDLSIAFSTGSMPSSHTAVVVSTSMAVGLLDGFASTTFAISFVFAGIVIHDAVKVRGESSKQAIALNELTDAVGEISEILNFKTARIEREKKLKELIGHTTSEVLAGIVLGIVISAIYFH